MFIGEREQMILNYLQANKMATTSVLTELTGASAATVRRDLNNLKKNGFVIKVHGGAKCVDSAGPFTQKKSLGACPNEKNEVALIAQKIIEPGNIVFLGAGVTNTLISRYIKDKENLLVITTNINAVLELSCSKTITVLLLGGQINYCENHIETLDENTLQSVNKYFFDKAFITVDGIDLTEGYSIISRLQIPLYHYLLQNCKQFYLVADSGKFDKRAFTHFCGINDIPNIITNVNTDRKYLNYYKNNGINVITG